MTSKKADRSAQSAAAIAGQKILEFDNIFLPDEFLCSDLISQLSDGNDQDGDAKFGFQRDVIDSEHEADAKNILLAVALEHEIESTSPSSSPPKILLDLQHLIPTPEVTDEQVVSAWSSFLRPLLGSSEVTGVPILGSLESDGGELAFGDTADAGAALTPWFGELQQDLSILDSLHAHSVLMIEMQRQRGRPEHVNPLHVYVDRSGGSNDTDMPAWGYCHVWSTRVRRCVCLASQVVP